MITGPLSFQQGHKYNKSGLVQLLLCEHDYILLSGSLLTKKITGIYVLNQPQLLFGPRSAKHPHALGGHP